MLERKGMIMNHKNLYRLYAEEKLGVRRRRGRKRALGSRTTMPEALRPGERWSLDFLSDVRCHGQVPHPGGERRLLP